MCLRGDAGQSPGQQLRPAAGGYDGADAGRGWRADRLDQVSSFDRDLRRWSSQRPRPILARTAGASRTGRPRSKETPATTPTTSATATSRDAQQPRWGSFEIAFLVIFGGAILASFAGLPMPSSLRSVAQPGLVALVLVAGFAWRPQPGLLAFALYILFYDTAAFYLGGSLRNVDEIAVPLLLVVALAKLRPWSYVRIDPVRDGAVAVAVAVGILSSLVAGVPVSIWAPALALLWKTVAIFYVASWLPIDRRSVVGAARVVLTLGFAVLALGFIEGFNPAGFQERLGLPIWFRPRGELPSIKSVFMHPAIFASFASLVTLYAYAGFVEFRKIWMLVLATFGAMTVFMAARRRAITAAVLGLAAAFAWSARRVGLSAQLARSWVPVTLSGLVLMIIFLPGLLGLVNLSVQRYLPGEQPTPPPGVQEPEDGEGAVPTRARSALYGASLEIARDYFPLGAGLGRYGSHLSRVEYSPLYDRYGLSELRGLQEENGNYITDTFWPMVLGETGVAGAMAYGVFVLALLVALWRAVGRQHDRLLRAFMMGTLAVLVAAVAESLATPMFVAPPRAYLVFVVVGAAIALANRTPADAQLEPEAEAAA